MEACRLAVVSRGGPRGRRSATCWARPCSASAWARARCGRRIWRVALPRGDLAVLHRHHPALVLRAPGHDAAQRLLLQADARGARSARSRTSRRPRASASRSSRSSPGSGGSTSTPAWSAAAARRRCPAYLAGSALSPKQIIVKLKRHMHGELPGPIHGELIKADELWACTTCMACVQECPAFIDIVRHDHRPAALSHAVRGRAALDRAAVAAEHPARRQPVGAAGRRARWPGPRASTCRCWSRARKWSTSTGSAAPPPTTGATRPSRARWSRS